MNQLQHFDFKGRQLRTVVVEKLFEVSIDEQAGSL